MLACIKQQAAMLLLRQHRMMARDLTLIDPTGMAVALECVLILWC